MVADARETSARERGWGLRAAMLWSVNRSSYWRPEGGEEASSVEIWETTSAVETACPKTLGLNCAWHVGGTVRKPLWLEQSERGGKREGMRAGRGWSRLCKACGLQGGLGFNPEGGRNQGRVSHIGDLFFFFFEMLMWTALVVQWLRIHLPMQATWSRKIPPALEQRFCATTIEAHLS